MKGGGDRMTHFEVQSVSWMNEEFDSIMFPSACCAAAVLERSINYSRTNLPYQPT
ncbi:hypothetical protein J6590_074126 [Homalodisca vitripennis]|nr:hypothetical protein J6590_074126 [Homalodisca vitripennis]